MHVNKTNGKKYIGITCKDVNRRWGLNGNGYKGSTYFYRAIQKYGWDNFEHIVLQDGLDETTAKQQEVELIKKHKTVNSKYGYNLTYGGQGNVPNETTRRKMSDAQKRLWDDDYYKNRMTQIRKGTCSSVDFKNKVSKNSKKRWSNPEFKQKMINILKESAKNEDFITRMKEVTTGEKNGFHGKKHTDEAKLKMRAKKIGKKLTKEHINKVSEAMKKPVVMFDKKGVFIKVFPSATDAKVFVGSNYSCHINACCNGKRKTAYGYKWMYLEEYEQTKSAN